MLIRCVSFEGRTHWKLQRDVSSLREKLIGDYTSYISFEDDTQWRCLFVASPFRAKLIVTTMQGVSIEGKTHRRLHLRNSLGVKLIGYVNFGVSPSLNPFRRVPTVT
ncbi:hypothetical protein QL285_015180 [Trifolium repens]|nr:hypothetical protein QL285_015180 [Trifolium repens]